MATELTWHDVLAEEKQQPYFVNTLHTVAGERQSGMTIYPPQKDVFNAFRFTELGDVKVVIWVRILTTVGPGTRSRVLCSPRHCHSTLVAEHVQRAGGNDSSFTRPTHGYLESWARQRGYCYSTPYSPSAPARHILTPALGGKHLPIKSSV